MPELPNRPFLTDDFSTEGGGIDFLGMRWANLEILTRYLLPDINNATNDFGIYCLAAWIPWKFRTLCTDPKQFKRSVFLQFRQAVEVAMSYATRDDSSATGELGQPNVRIGARQKIQLPSKLTFERAHRTEATSIYAAPLYGPSVRFLGLIAGEAMATDGSRTGIPLTNEDDPQTMALVYALEERLSQSRRYRIIAEMASREFNSAELDDLGLHGLHPAMCRQFNKSTKRAFLAKLIPQPVANGRTWTARLLVETLRRGPALDSEGLRALWHTGLRAEGRHLKLSSDELILHRQRWSLFQVRQYQRYVLELFLKCFELAISAGARRINDITDATIKSLGGRVEPSDTLRAIFLREAQVISPSQDLNTVTARWNELVHGEHPSYVWIPQTEQEPEAGRAIRMLARWWIGSRTTVMDERNVELTLIGGEDRLSMRWFLQWVEQRLEERIDRVLPELFEQLVFAQHVRVALSRFDGEAQRLRFSIGDNGICPTNAMAQKMGKGIPGWTADRLDAFINLLVDLSVLDRVEEGFLRPGPLADEIAII
jgi:hypothetical protein